MRGQFRARFIALQCRDAKAETYADGVGLLAQVFFHQRCRLNVSPFWPSVSGLNWSAWTMPLFLYGSISRIYAAELSVQKSRFGRCLIVDAPLNCEAVLLWCSVRPRL